jgi:TetR/AcrR family transcriptional repressor of nem operon
MATKVTKGEQTRRHIVAKAAPVFNERGFEGASLADLMDATGLKKGGIYRHFSSKEELAAEAFDFTWAAAQHTRIHDLDDKAGIPWLKALVANFVERRPPIAGGCPILNTAIDADDGNSVLRTRVLKALRQWTGRIEGIVRTAIASGEIPASVDPTTVATIIVSTLEGALMMSRLEHRDDPLRRVQAHLDGYLDGLAVAQAPNLLDLGVEAAAMSPTARKKPSHGRGTAPPDPPQPKRQPDGDPDAHQGAIDEKVSRDRAGSGAGYDLDPKKVKNKGGVET